MGMGDEACCERETKSYIPPKGETTKVQEPQHTQDAFSCHILTLDPKSQNPLADPLWPLRGSWERHRPALLLLERPCEKKAAELKETMVKGIAA